MSEVKCDGMMAVVVVHEDGGLERGTWRVV